MSNPVYDIGFLGGGQLARMSIQAAQRMGLRCISLDPASNSPAARVGAAITGGLDNPSAIKQLAEQCCALTLENEFIPVHAIQQGTAGLSVPLIPSLSCLGLIQDKLAQRLAYAKYGVPSPIAFELTDPVESLEQQLGYPMVLKSRFGGYDGKGTLVAKDRAFVEQARPVWSQGGWLAEKFMPFSREVAAMVVRTPLQSICFPVMETYQPNLVCDVTLPAAIRWNVDQAQAVAIKAVEAVGGYGLFGVEMFQLQNGDIAVNEIAPRPHNTGHYTMDWGRLSQFDLHVRVALGLPLPDQADLDGLPIAMVNLFGIEGAGDFRKGIQSVLAHEPAARVHWYEKSDAKPGRKMGHINLDLNEVDGCKNADEFIQYMQGLRDAFEQGWRA